MKILVAEDDSINRSLMQEIMEEFGTVEVAENGVETVDAFKRGLEANEPFDLICLDIMMPEMDGQEALLEIRKIEREKNIESSGLVKVVMTTALSDSKNIMNALVKGTCNGYLNKPISTDEIKKTLTELELL